MVNPKIEFLNPDDEPAKWDYSRTTPIYRGTADLPSHQIARFIQTALNEALPSVQETLSPELLKKRGLPGVRDAIQQMHAPTSPETLGRARRRLVYEEL